MKFHSLSSCRVASSVIPLTSDAWPILFVCCKLKQKTWNQTRETKQGESADTDAQAGKDKGEQPETWRNRELVVNCCSLNPSPCAVSDSLPFSLHLFFTLGSSFFPCSPDNHSLYHKLIRLIDLPDFLLSSPLIIAKMNDRNIDWYLRTPSLLSLIRSLSGSDWWLLWSLSVCPFHPLLFTCLIPRYALVFMQLSHSCSRVCLQLLSFIFNNSPTPRRRLSTTVKTRTTACCWFFQLLLLLPCD